MLSKFYKDGLNIKGLPFHTYRENEQKIYEAFFNNIPEEILDKIVQNYEEYIKYHPAEKDLPVVMNFAQNLGSIPAKSLNSEESIDKILKEGFDFEKTAFSTIITSASKDYVNPFDKGLSNIALSFTVCITSKDKNLLVPPNQNPETYIIPEDVGERY